MTVSHDGSESLMMPVMDVDLLLGNEQALLLHSVSIDNIVLRMLLATSLWDPEVVGIHPSSDLRA